MIKISPNLPPKIISLRIGVLVASKLRKKMNPSLNILDMQKKVLGEIQELWNLDKRITEWQEIYKGLNVNPMARTAPTSSTVSHKSSRNYDAAWRARNRENSR
jgi:DNA/RNA-binding domain of Phe-tRNA-synthetase-like protein